MANPTTYSYTLTQYNLAQISALVAASTISIALASITANGSEVVFNFKDVLSSDDQTTLQSIITNYSYLAPVDPTQMVNVQAIPAFASKIIGNKSLFKRVRGVQQDLVVGDNTILYTEEFNWVKFMALEVINGEVGDYCSLYVLDSATGQVTLAMTGTAIPNYPLNQFGFNANIAAGFYSHRSEFDADVYRGLQIKIVYHSMTAKRIGINYVMNEVK